MAVSPTIVAATAWILTITMVFWECHGLAFVSPIRTTTTTTTTTTTLSATTTNTPSSHHDVLIIGGGLAGLSLALELATKHGRQVTVLERNTDTNTGSLAAAGMLAPQAERLPRGPLLDLCVQSRRLYPNWCQQVEQWASQCSDPTQLSEEVPDLLLQPHHVGYRATGGFLAPAFAGDSVATWAPPSDIGISQWLDDIQVRELEPLLHPQVMGGWWFPEDASVDARRLTNSLRAACQTVGVNVIVGPHTAARSLDLSEHTCHGVHLANGQVLSARAVVVANGAWMRDLLPVPIVPHKGQSFSLRMPDQHTLSRVLFAADTYLVPKADGRLVVGATVEPHTYDPSVTPAGLGHCFQKALELIPALAHWPLEETWSGLRPTTPDKAPLLGATSQWHNLYLAGGYWRNGVLLAPRTAELLGNLIAGDSGSTEDADRTLLRHFAWDRFTTPEGGAKVAADARYASSMHPVHGRAFVSGSVGTELGAYADARMAKAERQQDREALQNNNNNNDNNDDDAFERAAALGKQDARAFVWEEEESLPPQDKDDETPSPIEDSDDDNVVSETTAPLKDNDVVADTKTTPPPNDNDLSNMYETIRANKAKNQLPDENEEDDGTDDEEQDDRPDFDFRIWHVDQKSGEETYIPPYTNPDTMEGLFYQDFTTSSDEQDSPAAQDSSSSSSNGNGNQGIYDGYTEILKVNGDASRENELAAMRKARIANRQGFIEPVDEDNV